MLDRQIMFKQLQELQRKKKLQELNDARQQDVIDQLSLMHDKQSSGAQYALLNKGIPVRDASQMFMFGSTNLVQGLPKGLVYSQAQNQILHSMGLASQQLDGTAMSSSGNSSSRYSHFQGPSHESAGLLTKRNNEQAGTFSKSFLGDQFYASSNQERSSFGSVFSQGLDSGGQTGTVQQVNNHNKYASSQEFGRGQEGGSPGRFSEKMENVDTTQDLATLDPLEQKILFNDNSWGTSFGKHASMGTESFENMFENTDHLSDFPSVQSGSWSALMQSAVAEASSSDAGLQEEWSGLSFQNPELSNENQPSNLMENGKHPAPWLHNKLPKPELLNTSNASSSFPGFQHFAATHFQNPKTGNMHSDSNHQSPKEAGQVHQGLSGCEQGHAGEFEFVNNASNKGRDFKKGFLPDIPRNFKTSEEATFGSSDYSGMSGFMDRSAGFPSPNSTAHASCNMLELLHKVNKEYGHGTQSGYTDSAPITEVPKAEPEDVFTPSYNNSSRSQYFGLRLAPPSQRPLVSYFDPSQIPQQVAHSNKPFQDLQSDNNQLRNQNYMTNQSLLATLSYTGSKLPASNPDASQGSFHLVSVKQEDGQQLSTFEAKQYPTTSGMAQQVASSIRPPNIWVDVPVQQNPSAIGSCGPPSTSDTANRRLETAFDASKGLDYWKYAKGGNNFLESDALVINSQGLDDERGFASKTYFGKESLLGNREANAASSLPVQGSNSLDHPGNYSLAISPRDLEAFGDSLKQASALPCNHPLLNPMNHDPNVRVAIKNESVNYDSKIPQVTSLSQLNSAYGNYKSHLISSAATGDQLVKSSSQPPLQDISPDIVSYNKAPSWLKNHEASKTEQMLSMYDARVGNKAAQHLFVGGPPGSLEKNSSLVQVASIGQCGSVGPVAGTNEVDLTHSSSLYLQHLDVANQNMAHLKSKKRKFPTFERLPWHKEVTEGCSGLHDMSTAELEWAHSAGRLPEKLKQGVADSLWMVHPKRRLILTTQLMQLSFLPAPAIVLSEDATAHCDTVTYYAAKLALGDACSLASHSHMPHDTSCSSSGKSTASKSSGDQDLSKLVEGFIDRSKRLEDELSRLENGESSILDARMEFQDLEKFSVINRFAKFHSRGPLVTADTASSAGSSTMPKLYPQRYVTASPMPRTVPEGLHCLSL